VGDGVRDGVKVAVGVPGVSVAVGVNVGVGDGVRDGVKVAVGVPGVFVAVGVNVGVGVFVEVFVADGVFVGVFVAVAVSVGDGVFVADGVFVLVAVGDPVGVRVAVGVNVIVGVMGVGGVGVSGSWSQQKSRSTSSRNSSTPASTSHSKVNVAEPRVLLWIGTRNSVHCPRGRGELWSATVTSCPAGCPSTDRLARRLNWPAPASLRKSLTLRVAALGPLGEMLMRCDIRPERVGSVGKRRMEAPPITGYGGTAAGPFREALPPTTRHSLGGRSARSGDSKPPL